MAERDMRAEWRQLLLSKRGRLYTRRSPEGRPGGQGAARPSRRRGDDRGLHALAEEAHRRRMTYGALRAALTAEERERIIREWREQQPARVNCEGCRYWKDCSATSPEAGKACHFALERGHARRRNGGKCLEYQSKQELREARYKAF